MGLFAAALLELGIAIFEGKATLMTDSISGMGLAIARAITAQGANVAINSFGR